MEETQKVAHEFVDYIFSHQNDKKISGATIVGLYGDLGAGKTSFTQGVARALGIDETIVSPTFVIEKIYELPLQGRPFVHFIHIDAYRLEHSSELVSLGWQKIISDPTNLIFIEWPERVGDIMPEHIKINLEHTADGGRQIETFS